MTLYLKDPEASVDYGFDWSAGYLGGRTIAASSWTIAPVEASGVALTQSSFTTSQTIASLTGGKPGHVYRITNRVTLSDGSADERSLTLRVDSR